MLSGWNRNSWPPLWILRNSFSFLSCILPFIILFSPLGLSRHLVSLAGSVGRSPSRSSHRPLHLSLFHSLPPLHQPPFLSISLSFISVFYYLLVYLLQWLSLLSLFAGDLPGPFLVLASCLTSEALEALPPVQSLIWDSFSAASSTSPISSVILVLTNDILTSCYSSGIMLGSTVNQNPSQQSVYSPSSRHPNPPSAEAVAAASSSSQLESGSSRSTSTSTPASFSDTTNTPTSFAAPLSTSAAAAARGSARPSSHLPQRHDVPPYISHQSHDSSTTSSPSVQQASTTATRYFSSSPSTNTPAAAGPRPSTSSMNPSSSVTSSASSAAFSHGPPTTYPSSNINHTSASRSGSYSSPASSRLQPTSRPLRSSTGSEASSPNRIRVRDLSHVQSFAYEEYHAQSQRNSQVPGQWEQKRQYEISSMPVTDIIEMVAGLLTKITATNDIHHEQMHRHLPSPDGTANLSPQATSVLAFHGKNVPGISILSYLTRIHKYCPTTYEVFLSLLVYFDRMTEMVNKGHLDRVRHRWGDYSGTEAENNNDANSHNIISPSETESGTRTTQPMHTSPIVTPPSSTGMVAQDPTSPSSISPSLRPQGAGDPFSHSFVVDSFNIHRLVIAGVTCASKFFSDVFYTNSRYAKVGGLPLVELNHLELQFLLLNDFRLSIPVEELESYGTMLVEFYAREVVSQQQAQARSMNPSLASVRQPEVRQTPTPP